MIYIIPYFRLFEQAFYSIFLYFMLYLQNLKVRFSIIMLNLTSVTILWCGTSDFKRFFDRTSRFWKPCCFIDDTTKLRSNVRARKTVAVKGCTSPKPPFTQGSLGRCQKQLIYASKFIDRFCDVCNLVANSSQLIYASKFTVSFLCQWLDFKKRVV